MFCYLETALGHLHAQEANAGAKEIGPYGASQLPFDTLLPSV